MAKKRANTEGSVFYSKARGKWCAQLSAGPDGRRPLRTADTEKEALALLRQMHQERAAGRDLSRRSETVEELLTDYLASLEGTVRDATMLAYRNQVKHINERVGSVKYDSLAPEAVQRLASAIARDHGPIVARLSMARLYTAFEGVVPERVSRNPVNLKKIRLRMPAPAERRPLEDEQVRALLLACDNLELLGRYARYGIGVWLMALLGLRRGEAAGASWRDLNWEKGELHIRQQFAPALDGGFAIGPIKTGNGVRLLQLGSRLLARLRLQWETQQAERRLRGAAWSEHGLILAHEDGTPVRPDFLNHTLRRVCDLGKLPPVHPHLLRHTVATIISEEGYSEAVIAGVLGHGKGGNVTRRYTHATEKAKRNALAAVEGRVLGASSEGAKGAQ